MLLDNISLLMQCPRTTQPECSINDWLSYNLHAKQKKPLVSLPRLNGWVLSSVWNLSRCGRAFKKYHHCKCAISLIFGGGLLWKRQMHTVWHCSGMMDERTLVHTHYCLLRGSVPGFGEWTSFLSCPDVRTQHPLLLLLLFGLFRLKTQELQLLLHLSALKRFVDVIKMACWSSNQA